MAKERKKTEKIKMPHFPYTMEKMVINKYELKKEVEKNSYLPYKKGIKLKAFSLEYFSD